MAGLQMVCKPQSCHWKWQCCRSIILWNRQQYITTTRSESWFFFRFYIRLLAVRIHWTQEGCTIDKYRLGLGCAYRGEACTMQHFYADDNAPCTSNSHYIHNHTHRRTPAPATLANSRGEIAYIHIESVGTITRLWTMISPPACSTSLEDN